MSSFFSYRLLTRRQQAYTNWSIDSITRPSRQILNTTVLRLTRGSGQAYDAIPYHAIELVCMQTWHGYSKKASSRTDKLGVSTADSTHQRPSGGTSLIPAHRTGPQGPPSKPPPPFIPQIDRTCVYTSRAHTTRGSASGGTGVAKTPPMRESRLPSSMLHHSGRWFSGWKEAIALSRTQ